MSTISRGLLWIALTAALGACARPATTSATYVRAQLVPEPLAPQVSPPATVATVTPPPEAFAGQMKRLPTPPRVLSADAKPTAQQVVADANRKAAQAPGKSDTFNAIVQYAYEPGTLYQVFAAPMRITDIALEAGERILGEPALGDSVRWLLAKGKSQDHGVDQMHVYLKPTRPELETNLAINTDRRSYLLELHSYPDTYMAAVVWHYPEDELERLQSQASEMDVQQRSTASVVGLDALHFDYAIQIVKGSPAWTPLQVFDDGRRTFVRFPSAMLVREAPAFFVLHDKETQLVNYRVKGDTYVIDRLIDSAELRVGQQDQEIVRIVHGAAAQDRPLSRPIHAGSGQ